MNIKKFILDWVWQLPQNIIGRLYKSIIKNDIITPINEDSEYNTYLKRSSGSVSLGKYVFIGSSNRNLSNIILHEYGHCKQSKMLGPLYLIGIGIPSFTHAALHHYICNNDNYYHFYTESWANKLAGLKTDKIGRLYKINQ